MNQAQKICAMPVKSMLVLCLAIGVGLASARLDADAAPAGTAPSPKNETLHNYLRDCGKKPANDPTCAKLHNETVEILKEDLRILGATTKRGYVPLILNMLRSNEPVLRIAAADAIGMIGPQDQDVDSIIPAVNDPVPDVRRAISSLLQHGKGNAISLLRQRVMPQRSGQAPETPIDATKYSMPVAADSVYMFDSSDASVGRLSYVAKAKGDPAKFYKAKAKKGPFPLQDFKERYRYQFQDEDEALRQAQEAKGKEIEDTPPPDPSNVEAFNEYMQKVASVGVVQGAKGALDVYEPNLFGSPTVYVLEERQIGKRNYPTKYVVLYQELALKKPGYRLAWMTVSDSALKTAQATSLAEEKEELANKKETELLNKRQETLDNLTKKKDTAEKKQFKKGQEDLEKELGF